MPGNDNSQVKQIVIRFKEQSKMHMRVYDAIQNMDYVEYGSRNQMLIALIDEIIKGGGGKKDLSEPGAVDVQALRRGIAEDTKRILGDALSGVKGIQTDMPEKPVTDEEKDFMAQKEDAAEQEQQEENGIDNPDMLKSLIGAWNE